MIDRTKVEQVLKRIRPYLQEDEGDVQLININENNIVEIKLLGTCSECPLSPITLRAGIERALVNEIPQIKRVEAIN